MPRIIPFRLVIACALAVLFAASSAAIATAKVPVDLRVVGGGGKILAEEALKTGTTSVPTSPKATCFGKGTGGSGRAVKIKGATALGLLGQAARSTSTLKPLLLTDAFDFGLGICSRDGATLALEVISVHLNAARVDAHEAQPIPKRSQ